MCLTLSKKTHDKHTHIPPIIESNRGPKNLQQKYLKLQLQGRLPVKNIAFYPVYCFIILNRMILHLNRIVHIHHLSRQDLTSTPACPASPAEVAGSDT